MKCARAGRTASVDAKASRLNTHSVSSQTTHVERKLFEVVGVAGEGLGPVSLDLAAGECACLTGPSGSGKSRLLRAIADLDPHDGYSVLNQRACYDFAPQQWRLRVGLLPPESAWWAERAGDHFSTPSSRQLSELGLTAELLGCPVRQLSSGEKQRFALLRLLANRPHVLLLDEPTANLDRENTARVEVVIRRYLDHTLAASLWVSHNPEQIQRIGSRCLRMRAGKLDETAS